MKNWMLLILFVLATLPIRTTAQESSSLPVNGVISDTLAAPLRSDALNVFLDCMMCDRTYIKEVIPFVNYVNNRDNADVHIIMTRRGTGGGGTEHLVSFSGLRQYSGLNDTLTFFSPPNAASDFTRKGQANVISMGLMRFVARTPLAQNITVSYTEPVGNGKKLSQVVENDPWNSWVLRLSNRSSFNKDQNYENINFENSFSADRVTPDWKSEFDSQYEFSQRSITSNGITTDYPQTSWNLRTLQVKSLGDHMSAGANISASGSTYGNIRYAINIHPAIEYNIFPYSESFKRQVRIQYTVQANYANYMDSTMYFKLEEWVYRHQLALAVGLNQQWGSSSFSIRGGHFLNDINFWNFNLYGDVNWRVYRGLSVGLNARAAIIRDDRAVLKKSASVEDVLLQLRKLNSSYSYQVGVNLSFSFGSIYNNVVNPRFSQVGRN
jgi:hypothetical protein